MNVGDDFLLDRARIDLLEHRHPAFRLREGNQMSSRVAERKQTNSILRTAPGNSSNFSERFPLEPLVSTNHQTPRVVPTQCVPALERNRCAIQSDHRRVGKFRMESIGQPMRTDAANERAWG
jgi:hypothetical protein